MSVAELVVCEKGGEGRKLMTYPIGNVLFSFIFTRGHIQSESIMEMIS